MSIQLDTKNVDTSHRVCSPLFLSPSACYKYFNERVHHECGKGRPNSECGFYIVYCPPISRHLANFPPFFRETGPCHARPPACVGIIVVVLLRGARCISNTVAVRRSDARIDASRCVSCVRARAAGVFDSYRDARDCSSSWHSRGSTPDTCHKIVFISGVHDDGQS